MSEVPEEIREMQKRLPEMKARIARKSTEDVRFALSKLLKSPNQYEAFEVRLSSTRPGIDEETGYERGYYGPHLQRSLTSGEVAQIEGNQSYQKLLRSLSPASNEKLSAEELNQISEMKAEFVAKTLHQSMGITKTQLLDSGDNAYLNFMFSRLCEESGMGLALQEDMRNFFRDRGRQRTSVSGL